MVGTGHFSGYLHTVVYGEAYAGNIFADDLCTDFKFYTKEQGAFHRVFHIYFRFGTEIQNAVTAVIAKANGRRHNRTELRRHIKLNHQFGLAAKGNTAYRGRKCDLTQFQAFLFHNALKGGVQFAHQIGSNFNMLPLHRDIELYFGISCQLKIACQRSTHRTGAFLFHIDTDFKGKGFLLQGNIVFPGTGGRFSFFHQALIGDALRNVRIVHDHIAGTAFRF